MSGYGFFRSLYIIVGLGLTGIMSVLAFAVFAINTVVTELKYRNRFGPDWQGQFEDDIGPVAEQRLKGAACLIGAVAIAWILIWLYRAVRRPHAQGRPRRHKNRDRLASPVERIVRHRRKALVCVYFGIIGIAAALVLSLFRVGFFEDHANEVVLGIFIFAGAFCSVIAGCSAWLKAKGWNEAIAFIGVMPLAVLFVPFVRIIVLASGILPVAMVMMPIILVVVVLVLPDKSGLSRRRQRAAMITTRTSHRSTETMKET
jgi:Na+/melibiose symporter-like transporter